MTITVVGGTSKADQLEAWYQVRKKLSDIELELPEGVIGPIFNDEYGDVTGLLYAVKGDGISHAELSDVAEDIKRRLLKVPMVKKVDIVGKQAKKVYVEFSHQRLAALVKPIDEFNQDRKQPVGHRGHVPPLKFHHFDQQQRHEPHDQQRRVELRDEARAHEVEQRDRP